MAQSVGAVALDIVMGKNTVSGVARQAISDVQNTFNDGAATIGTKVSAIGASCKNMGGALLPVSVAAQGTIKSVTSAAMSFETAMAQVSTISGNASASYKGNMMDMSDAIMQLSADTGIAAEEIALATYNAISAGVDVSKSVEFVATANALAVGGFTDMTTSVDVLTTTLNAYGDKAGTAESISDKLITTQNLGKTTVDELASSMGKVIPSASAYGVSIDNLCASYVAMTKGGIATAESTTYMKSMLNELADSGSTVGAILQEKTGKSFGQLMAEGKSLADVIDILGKSVDGDTEAFAQLWGSSEAGTGALAILNGGTADFNNTLKEMQNSTGAASSAMDKMNDTSAHKMQVAMNDMKNAAIELGNAFAPVMADIAKGIGVVAKAFTSLPDPAKKVIAVVLAIVAVAAPLLIAIGSIISVVGSAITAVGTIKGALAGFKAFLSGSVVPALQGFFSFLAANPIILIITGIIAVGALLITHWEEVKQVASVVWEGVKNVISTVVDGIKNIITTAVNAIKNAISIGWNAIKSVTSAVFNAIKDFMSAIWNGIKSVVTGVVNGIKNVVSSAWNGIKSVTSTIFNGVKNTVSSIWNGIKNTVSNLANGAKNAATNAWNGIKNGITSAGNAIKNAVTNCFNNAKNTIKNFSSQAVQWGKDFATGLANGIKSAASKVVDAAKGLGSKIASYLHFSRPDVGPLREYETWMPDFVQGMANGIEANKYKLIDAVRGMAGQMNLPMMTAPALRNVGNGTAQQTGSAGDDRLYGLLSQLVANMQNMGGDITIPVYLGNDLIDEQIIRANDRRTVRSGGRA